MIHYFPEPYLDEHWYSVLARFKERMQYPTSKSNFPKSTPSFASNFAIKSKTIILQNTVFQYSTFGLSRQEKLEVLISMCQGRNSTLKAAPKSSIISLHFQHQIAFCPICLDQDKEMFGETYLHRLHSLPISKCPIHDAVLEKISPHVHKSNDFVTLNSWIHNDGPTIKLISNSSWELLVHSQVAKESAWIMNNSALNLVITNLQRLYQLLLNSQHFGTKENGNSIYKLQECFENFYTRKLLKKLNADPHKNSRLSWIFNLLENGVNQPAIKHILLVNFFGLSLQQFCRASTTTLKHQTCRNPSCSHFNALAPCHSQQMICQCGFLYFPAPKNQHNNCLSEQYLLRRTLIYFLTAGLSKQEIDNQTQFDKKIVRDHLTDLKANTSYSNHFYFEQSKLQPEEI